MFLVDWATWGWDIGLTGIKSRKKGIQNNQTETVDAEKREKATSRIRHELQNRSLEMMKEQDRQNWKAQLLLLRLFGKKWRRRHIQQVCITGKRKRYEGGFAAEKNGNRYRFRNGALRGGLKTHTLQMFKNDRVPTGLKGELHLNSEFK